MSCKVKYFNTFKFQILTIGNHPRVLNLLLCFGFLGHTIRLRCLSLSFLGDNRNGFAKLLMLSTSVHLLVRGVAVRADVLFLLGEVRFLPALRTTRVTSNAWVCSNLFPILPIVGIMLCHGFGHVPGVGKPSVEENLVHQRLIPPSSPLS